MLSGRDGKLQDGVPIPGCLGMVRQQRQLPLGGQRLPPEPSSSGGGSLTQGIQDSGVQHAAPGRSDCRQNGVARQIMTKGKAIIGPAQQAAGDARIDLLEHRTGDALQEIKIDRRADHRRHVEHRPRLWREPRRAGQDRIADRGRHPLILGRQYFGQEKRVAPGQAIQDGRVSPAPLCQLTDGHFRKRTQAHAVDGRRCRQIAKDRAQGVIAANFVVAVGNEVQVSEVANPPAKKAEDFERGAIGPVGILTDEHDGFRARGQRRQDGPEELFASLALEETLVTWQAEHSREVTHRTEGTRCRERVARESEHVDLARDPPAEFIDQRRLADAGLAGKEDDAAMPRGGLPQVILKLLEIRLAFEKRQCRHLLAVRIRQRRWQVSDHG
jgi:hypothetical protein